MGTTARAVAWPLIGAPTGSESEIGGASSDSSPSLPFVAVAGLAVSVGMVVASVPIGGGDYGQWLMVSRQFLGATVPAYRDLSQSAPGVPVAIAAAMAAFGDPMTALHAVGFGLVVGLGAAFFAAGWLLDRRRLTGLLAAAVGLLVSDQFLDLLAFGGLPQAAGIASSVLAVSAFAWANRDPAHERVGWAAGCLALLGTCLAHVATATVMLPACLAVAALGARGGAGQSWRMRARTLSPLAAGFAAVGAYWLLAVVPPSRGLVANPASLAFRGPERVFDLLTAYGPTLAVVVIGFGALAAWLLRHALDRRLPLARDPWTAVAVWTAAAWGSYGWSAVTGASTDYPRFGPILVAPLIVAASAWTALAARWLRGRLRIRPTNERGVVVLGLAIALVAPFSLARYEASARGYQLTDSDSLQAAATWIDARLLSTTTVLASAREAKWIEGLTGHSALFSQSVRYAFRPDEWQRSLVAKVLLQGDVALANQSFVATLTDDVGGATQAQPRGLLVAANHGGELLDLLRIAPDQSGALDATGTSIARLSGLAPGGFATTSAAGSIAASTAWTAVRQGETISVAERVSLADRSTTLTYAIDVASPFDVPAVRIDLRPASIPILGVVPEGAGTASPTALLTFPRQGRTAPQLRLGLDEPGSITADGTGGVYVTASGPHLSLEVTDLTAGGASSPLQVLDASALVGQYDVGAAVLAHDASYAERVSRLELLGFHPAVAEGPYVVLVRSSAVRRGAAS